MKYLKISFSLLLIALLAFAAFRFTGTKPDFPENVEIGVTTFDEIMKMDPSAQAICLSYGYMTHHTLDNGSMVSIKFVYSDGEFIATEINYF